MKDLFSMREEEIFQTLKNLSEFEFVVIGGYAVNAYTLPRFSVDCDIVIKNSEELRKIEKRLLYRKYKKVKSKKEMPYSGSFARYEKRLENEFIVSIDILIQTIIDRGTKVSFDAEWVFENSKIQILKGKTINEELNLRIINIEALIVMKIISCRNTDIRDVFMMFPYAEKKEWIIMQIKQRYNIKDRMQRISEKVSSKQFKDGLSGVYGYFDQKIFEKHKKAINDLGNGIS